LAWMTLLGVGAIMDDRCISLVVGFVAGNSD
jgi:hypothetical protein